MLPQREEELELVAAVCCEDDDCDVVALCCFGAFSPVFGAPGKRSLT